MRCLVSISALAMLPLVAQPLMPGKPISGRMEKGAKRFIPLPLEANQFARLRLEHRNMGAGVTITDASGKAVWERANAIDPGTVDAAFFFDRAGSYQVQLACDATHPCTYTLQLVELRAQREGDAQVMRAQQLEAQGAAASQIREAEKPLLEALQIWDQQNDDRGRASTLAALCHVSRYLDKPASQREFAERLLDVSRKLADPFAEATGHYHLGIALASQNNHARAIDEMEKAVELTGRNNDPAGLGSSLNILGSLLNRIGETQRALGYYQRALPIFRDLSDTRLIAGSLFTIGTAQQELGRHDEAAAPLAEALKLYRQLKDKRNEALLLRDSAATFEARKQYAEAEKSYREAIAIARELKGEAILASTLTSLGEHFANLSQWDPAATALEEALAVYRRNPQVTVNAATLNWLARVETERGNLDRAEALLLEAIAIVESGRAQAGGANARGTFLAVRRPVYGAMIEVLRRKPGNEGRALEWSERSRAAGFRELLAQSKIELKPETQAQLKALDAEMQAKTREIVARPGAAASAQRDALADVRDRRERLQARMLEGTPLSPLPSFETIQREMLDADTVLIEFFVGSKRSYVWAVTQTTVTFAPLAGRDALTQQIRAAYNAVTARSLTAEARQALFTALLKPVEAQLQGRKRWLIVADEWIHYVPFAALPAAQNAEIVQLPSIAALASIRELAKGRKPASKLIAAFADPVFSASDSRVVGKSAAAPTLARLPFTRREVTGILAGLPPTKVLLATDFKASRETVAATDFSQFRAAHFATHGVLDETSPELSGILLSMSGPNGEARNGALRLLDLYQLKLPVELAVLSGCQTALGKNVPGEGIVGLTRGMMYAGAQRVLSSLWKVDDSATAELMRLFYQAYLGGGTGKSAAAALRQAQNGLRAQRRWQDPYYWAGFQLYGEYR